MVTFIKEFFSSLIMGIWTGIIIGGIIGLFLGHFLNNLFLTSLNYLVYGLIGAVIGGYSQRNN